MSTGPLRAARSGVALDHARPARGAQRAVRAVLEGAAARVPAPRDDDGARARARVDRRPAFCAGADLKEMAEHGPPRCRRPTSCRSSAGTHTAKPVIAAVNGHAFGGGFGLAQTCDIAIAAETRAFAASARCGVARRDPGDDLGGGRCRSSASIRAMRLFLTGERFDAARALALGLVHRVVPRERTRARRAGGGRRDRAGRTARRRARPSAWSAPSRGCRWTRRFAYAEAKIAELFASPEAAEGMARLRDEAQAALERPMSAGATAATAGRGR